MRQSTDEQVFLARRICTLRGARDDAADAVLVRDGRIAALGRRRPILAAAHRGARRHDFGDALLTPGLVDCHTHFFYWALQRALVIDVSDCRSLEETLARIARDAARRRMGAWVVARGFDCNTWADGWPSARDLDRACRAVPAMVRSRDGHTAWLNTLGLRTCRITAQTADPPGGGFDRDARGRPTGIVREAAIQMLPNPLRDLALQPGPRDAVRIERALQEAFEIAWRFGLVGVHALDDAPSLLTLQRLHRERRLGLRIAHSIPLEALPAARDLGLTAGWGDDWLRIAAVKIFADGALGSQTAYMLDPYPDRGEYCGVPVVAGGELSEAVAQASRAGWPVWIHAIGDRAVREAIDAIVAARRLEPMRLPHRIEHAQCVRPRDARRMARAGIVASMQPCHLLGDIANAERYWPRATRYTHAWRSLRDAGVPLALGSDVPVESIDPRRSFFAGATRTDEQGAPAGGWFPQERLEAHELLAGFALGAAHVIGNATPRGRIAPGHLADFTVWLDDPCETPPEQMRTMRIGGCVIAGTPRGPIAG